MSGHLTNVYDKYGNPHKATIRNGQTFLEDGRRIPVGWTVETKGGLYQMGSDGKGFKIDQLRFETPRNVTEPINKAVPRSEGYSEGLRDTPSYSPRPAPSFNFDTRRFDDYFSEMERVQLEKMRRAREQRKQVLENQKGRIGTEYDKVIGDINLQKEQAAPRYHQARNQADAMYFDNARRLEEMLADEGTAGGGKSISANVGLMGQRLGAMSDLNLSEQEFYDQADKNIADAMMERAQRIGEIDEAIMNLEAQGIDDENLLMSELRAERFRLELEMAQFEANYNLQVYGMENEYGFRREDMDLRRLGMLSDLDYRREDMDLRRYGMEKDYDYREKDYGYKDREMELREKGFQSDQDYRKWQMDMSEREFQRVLDNDAWSRSKDNPAVQAQMLQNAIMQVNLDYLPQEKQMGIKRLQAEISALNRPSAGKSGPSAYELEMTKLKLEDMITGRYDKEVNKYQSQINNLNYGYPTDADKVKYIGNLGASGSVDNRVINQLLLLNGLPSNERDLRKIVQGSNQPTKKDPWYNKLIPRPMRN